MLLKFKYLHWITLKRSTCRINTWGSLVAVGPFPGLQRSTLQTWPVCSSAWDGSAQTFTLSHWSPLVWHRGFSFCILSKKVLIISHTTCTQLTKMFISRPRVAGAGTNKLKCQKNIPTGSHLTQMSARVPNLDDFLNLNNFGQNCQN